MQFIAHIALNIKKNTISHKRRWEKDHTKYDRRWRLPAVHTHWWTSAGSRYRAYRAGKAQWRPGACSRNRFHRTNDTLFRASAGSRHRTYRAGEAHWRPGAWIRHRWHQTDDTLFGDSPLSWTAPHSRQPLVLPPKNLGVSVAADPGVIAVLLFSKNKE